MQKSLTQKRQELEQMNEAANAKLKQMVQDQQEAEKRKTMSQRLQEELASQEIFINEKRTLVMTELSQVEPAVNEAKQGKWCSSSFTHFFLMLFIRPVFAVISFLATNRFLCSVLQHRASFSYSCFRSTKVLQML